MKGIRKAQQTGGKKRTRRGRPSGPWVTARKLVQYAALLVFVLFFIASQRGGWPPALVNLPMRLDPLVMVASLLSSKVFLAGSALALIVILLTVVFGRAWCGWVCPLGTTLDLFSLKRWRGKRPPPPEAWRSLKYILLVAILIAALFGNLTLLVFDPLTILFRTLTVSLWPALDQVVQAAERILYPVPLLSEPVSRFDAWVRPGILPPEPVYYRTALLFFLLCMGVVALNIFAQRFWCRYVCPLGGMLGLISKFALLHRVVGEDCKGCTVCTNVCPTGTINPGKGYTCDPSECTLCLDCLEACPRGQIAFTPGISMAAWNEYDPSRRQALLAIASTVTAVALLKTHWLTKHQPPYLLRPPGAAQVNPDLLAMTNCVRCGECIRACPTNALQPAVFEGGLESFATPLLIARTGYCDYSCNACGQVCPVQAIPPLSLEVKRQQVIGKAYIDERRCIAWSDHQECIVCEEMCPLPEKAIELEEKQVWTAGGSQRTLQLPQVVVERCIGCGICEYKCPVNGEAAIRVNTPETTALFNSRRGESNYPGEILTGLVKTPGLATMSCKSATSLRHANQDAGDSAVCFTANQQALAYRNDLRIQARIL